MEHVLVTNIYADSSMIDIAPNGVFMDYDSSGQIFQNIRVDGTAGGQYRQNAGPHTFENVSWKSGFDDTVLDEPQINLRPDFPTVYLQ